MKKIILCICLLFCCFAFMQAQNNQPKLLRHVVMFGWKAGTEEAEIKKIVDAFKALPAKINLIKSFEWGTNNSPEKLNQGLSHCFLLYFESEKDRDAYIIHPDHKRFVDMPKPGLDKVTVFDYWVQQ